MSLGTRQMVLMTFMAIRWPEETTIGATRELVLKGCKHPRIFASFEHPRTKGTAKTRQCHCWHEMPTSVVSIFKSLLMRDFITQDGSKFSLTPKGWATINRHKHAPIEVDIWNEGYPAEGGIVLKVTRRHEYQVIPIIREPCRHPRTKSVSFQSGETKFNRLQCYSCGRFLPKAS